MYGKSNSVVIILTTTELYHIVTVFETEGAVALSNIVRKSIHNQKCFVFLRYAFSA